MEKKTDNPLVSIVIPVYNVAEYLPQCIESVIGQTYGNLEIIIVDDGSTDNSLEVIENYRKKDFRIRLLSQENKGVSSARNTGLDVATGKYIIFWDSDDFFHQKAIEYMVEKAEKEDADVCICDAQNFISDTEIFIHHPYIIEPKIKASIFSWKDCPDHIFFVGSGVPWNKLVLLSLLKENDIRFPDVPQYEDNHYTFLVVCYAKRITLCKKRLVYYRVDRPNCLSLRDNNDSYNVVTVYRKIYDDLVMRGLLEDDTLRTCFIKKTASMYHYRIRYCKSFDEYERLYKSFLSDESVLSEAGAISEKIKRIYNMKTLSASEYLLDSYKNLIKADALRQQKAVDASR